MNDQQKKQIVIASILGAVLVGVLVYQLVLAGDPPPASKVSESSTEKASTDAKPEKKSSSKKPAEEVNVLEVTEIIDIDELTQSVEVQPLDYSAVRIKRNPMDPLVGVTSEVIDTGGGEEQEIVVSKQPREVTGIIWDSVHPVAIIDNLVVHKGYVFADGVVVYDIEPTRVLLKIGESISPLEMKEF